MGAFADRGEGLASILAGGNDRHVGELYRSWLGDPASVDSSWQAVFSALEPGLEQEAVPAWGLCGRERPGELAGTGLRDLAGAAGRAIGSANRSGTPDTRRAATDTIRAVMMIRNYRLRGHLHARLDPLDLMPVIGHQELDPHSYGFGDADFDRPIFIDNLLGLEFASLREILALLRQTYCQTIGFEYMHIFHTEQRLWLQKRIEGRDKGVSFTDMGKHAILRKLSEAEAFERFCHLKYPGKRFGLDGAESVIPALEAVIKTGGRLGVQEILIGMPHRGRLNVLGNVMGKPFRAIFSEFQGKASTPESFEALGDVKYHLGASSDRAFDGNNVHLSLSPNPSHLEAIDPVILGRARAKQDQIRDEGRNRVLGLLLHGDAAFAGQGLVAECFALSHLKGYRVGGIVHFIINNQIGFTATPAASRSSPYPSDVAKMIQSPIFHVNGDDPEAVIHATKIATEFRQQFSTDVVIDMFCYRRFGHNETDEPMFTQPRMYRKIRGHPTTRAIYARRLVAEGIITAGEAEQEAATARARLEEEHAAATTFVPGGADWLGGKWTGLTAGRHGRNAGDTAVDLSVLRKSGEALTRIPDGFNLHPTLRRILRNREKSLLSGTGIDWSTAEALAMGSLLDEGYRVRLSGQDSGRGTFSQRHAVWVDQETEETCIPLSRFGGAFEVIDSALSEYAILGFEYGYSLAEPGALCIWEAQFGDFANGAQVIVDQFVMSGETKWQRLSGLVMLLPHGFEGAGPEHSSARPERFLQMCANDNVQVCNLTTPANYFHALRRQLRRDFRKPLVIMTPKSLLRHRKVVSRLDEMGPGSSFHRVLGDPDAPDPGSVRRVILCTGKVFFDLDAWRGQEGITDTAIIRIEQLYPFPGDALAEELSRYPQARVHVWAQEEPVNMGAWVHVHPRIAGLSPAGGPVYAGRPAASSPATGYMKNHLAEQEALVRAAFGKPAS